MLALRLVCTIRVCRDAHNERNIALFTSHNHSFVVALAFAVCAIILASVPASGQGTASAPAPHAQESTLGLGNYRRATKAEKLASCMALWEPATHMTKKRWRTVCKRVQTDD